MQDFVVPRDAQGSVIETFRQIRLALHSLYIPILKDKCSVQSIAEGRSAYFKEADGRLYRYTKIDGELVGEALTQTQSVTTGDLYASALYASALERPFLSALGG